MKVNFRIVGKIALLLVVIGFLMPVFSNSNDGGFQIAGKLMKSDKNFVFGVLFYVLFISAAAGACIGIFLLLKRQVRPEADWIVLIVCIISGLIIYFGHYSSSFSFLGNKISTSPKLDTGAYVILAGWIVALVSQFLVRTKVKRRR